MSSPVPVVQVRVLGHLEVIVDGQSLHLGGPKQRAVLGVLALEPNRVVPVERLVSAVWGEEDAGDRTRTLQVHMSNLRRALKSAAQALGREQVLVTRPPGYALEVPSEGHDLLVFERNAAEARDDVRCSDFLSALGRFKSALTQWRGTPLADLADEPFVANVATRLEAARAAVVEDRYDVELALGRHAEVLTDLVGLLEDDPLNERRRALVMVALYRCGRQAQALEVYQAGRRLLADELGLQPSPDLQALEGRILAQDPTLAAPAAEAPTGETATVLRSSIAVPSAALVVGDRRVLLERAVTSIGRRAENDIVMDDDRVSRGHAVVRRVGDDYMVVDQSSSNGTFVNDEQVTERVLTNGDSLMFGSTVVRFEVG
jgi:DNA-binding SARP family transcriptional activator